MTLMPSRKWMWITLCLTLILGMSLGVLLDRFVLARSGIFSGQSREDRGASHRSREERRRGYLEKLSTELDLSPEQKASLEKVLKANREKTHDFFKESRGAYAKLREGFRDEVRILLTSEQQERFNEILAREHDRRKKNNR